MISGVGSSTALLFFSRFFGSVVVNPSSDLLFRLNLGRGVFFFSTGMTGSSSDENSMALSDSSPSDSPPKISRSSVYCEGTVDSTYVFSGRCHCCVTACYA